MKSFDEWFDENCDGSDLAKDACRKLWDEFSDQINIICRKSYEKQQSKVDELKLQVAEMKSRLNDAYTAGQSAMYAARQSKVDELQKKNSWLSDVAERENKRANKLQEEKVSTTTLLGKTIQEKNELQKRVDAVKTLIQEYRDPPTEDKTFRHALSIVADELEQALKGESNESST